MTTKAVYPIYPCGNLSPEAENWPKDNILEAIKLWSKRKNISSDEVLTALRWDSMFGCYCFGWCGMFVGVELDGHIHT